MLLPLTEAIKHNPSDKILELGPPETEAFTTCKGKLLNIQIQVNALLFYKGCLNFRCSLFVLFLMKFFLILYCNTQTNQKGHRGMF